MVWWEIVNVLYQFIGFCQFVQSVNAFFFFFIPALKFSWTQYWNHLLKTHLSGTAQSCQFIQKWSSCSSYMLLSQCIQKFHFNHFTPVVHGLKQLLPCTWFSVPGDAPHFICVCHSNSGVLVSNIRADLEKICSLYEVMASNCQTLPLLTCLSSSTCSVSSSAAVKGREVVAAWAGMTCRWENRKIRNDRKGRLNLSPSRPCFQWLDQCKEASGLGHWWKQACFHQWPESTFKIALKAHRRDGRTGGAESSIEGDVAQVAWPQVQINTPFKYNQLPSCLYKVCREGRLLPQRGVLWGRVWPPLWLHVGERSKVTCWAVCSWADGDAMIL